MEIFLYTFHLGDPHFSSIFDKGDRLIYHTTNDTLYDFRVKVIKIRNFSHYLIAHKNAY